MLSLLGSESNLTAFDFTRIDNNCTYFRVKVGALDTLTVSPQ